MSTSGPTSGADTPPDLAGSEDDHDEVDEGPEPVDRSRKSRVRQGVQAAISFLLVVAVVWFVLPQIADFSKVWDEIRDLTGIELGVLAIAAAWNLFTYWVIVMICTPGLTMPQALVVTETTTAVSNTIPAGGAVAVGLNYAMLASWGFSKSRITISVVISGLWNNFAKLAMPIVALILLALQGDAGGGRLFAAVAGMAALVASVVVFALMLRSEDFARRAALAGERAMSSLRRVFKRGPVQGWDDAVLKFRSRVIGLVQRRWLALTAATLIGHLSLYAVLLLALRQVGVSEQEVSWAQVLTVFAFARLLTAIPITPGGLGVIELALITGINAAGGENAQVVAAVLMFRALTFVLPIPFGLATYIFWRRNKSWLNSAPPLTEFDLRPS